KAVTFRVVPLAASGLRRARFHLVAGRLLGRGDHLDRAPLGLDLGLRRRREVVRADRELLGHLALPEDADAVARAVGQPDAPQRFVVDRRAVLEVPVEVADVDDEEMPVPGGVAEAALRDDAEERHLAALEEAGRLLGAGRGVLALGAARGGLAVPAARA